MQEQHRLAVRPDLRPPVAEHAGATRFEPGARRFDVPDLVAHVVDAAARVAFQEARDGGRLPEHRQELDLRIRQIDEHRGHAMLGEVHRSGHRRPERVAIHRAGGGKIRHRDRDVVEPSDHCIRSFPSFPESFSRFERGGDPPGRCAIRLHNRNMPRPRHVRPVPIASPAPVPLPVRCPPLGFSMPLFS